MIHVCTNSRLDKLYVCVSNGQHFVDLSQVQQTLQLRLHPRRLPWTALELRARMTTPAAPGTFVWEEGETNLVNQRKSDDKRVHTIWISEQYTREVRRKENESNRRNSLWKKSYLKI